ncbi:MAG: MBL fold metallo-hydrolase [Oscillospiraceae bacterium]
MRKTYITTMPNKSGAFLLASEVVSRNGGNIARVSYNKAVDLHTLFLDVDATQMQLERITKELLNAGYLSDDSEQAQVILVEFIIRDIPGAIFPILKILSEYDVNISYINSQENATDYQNFKMGLLIQNPSTIKNLLDRISKLCDVRIIDYDSNEKILDNTVFYITFANEMKNKLSLSHEQMREVIADSNRIMQRLDDNQETPQKTFEYIRRFADFILKYKGDNFVSYITKKQISPRVTLHTIEPPCGSNTYILKGDTELLFIDSGFACFSDEMFQIFHELFPNFDSIKKSIWITHIDIDHCGLLNYFDEVYLNQKGAENFKYEREGNQNFREQNKLSAPYCRLSRIISNYQTPNEKSFKLIDQFPVENSKPLSLISHLQFEDLNFAVYQGSGGHILGETIFVCKEHGIIFTGDNLVNINGFSKEQSEFSILAPYLMTSVNIDSKKAKEVRNAIIQIIHEIEEAAQKQCLICGGHGAISVLKENRLVNVQE